MQFCFEGQVKEAPSSSASDPNLGRPSTLTTTAAAMEERKEEEEDGTSPRGAATALSRSEVMRRRRRDREDYGKHLRSVFWALMEQKAADVQRYDWVHGKSPFVEDESTVGGGENDDIRDEGRDENGDRRRCAFSGCKSMAMPLTRYCHPHILNDPKQTLYKPCNFIVKSNPQIGQIICAKPVDVAATPSLCAAHLQKVQKSVAQASKKLGLRLDTSSSRKSITKFTNVIADSVRQIQTRRRKALQIRSNKAVDEGENVGRAS